MSNKRSERAPLKTKQPYLVYLAIRGNTDPVSRAAITSISLDEGNADSGNEIEITNNVLTSVIFAHHKPLE